jgi:pimeloyl-ACP methyl ester carboxylesterase
MYPAGPCGDPRIGVRYVALAGGDRVRVVECGAGPAVVLLHGWGASAYTYRRAVLPLADAGFRVLVPDVPGHGLSDKPLERERYSLPRLADAVREVLDLVGVGRFAVAGHSMGGGLALHLALGEPARVTHLALLGSARLGRVQGISLLRALALGAAAPLYPHLVTRFGVRLLLRRVYGRGQAFTPRDVDEYWAPSQYPSYARAMWAIVQEYDWSLVEPDDVRGLRVPTLIMTAERDFIVSVREAADYARAIPGATLETVTGSGHLFPEAAWERTNAALLALLRRPAA